MTNYDDIATEYLKSKTHPVKKYVETYTFKQLAVDLQAKTVLDLACGDGYYTRLLKQLGAERVVGMDLSPVMINRALQWEVAEPLGIEYRVQDVTTLSKIGQFDLVTAVWLLCYASTTQILTTMCQNIYDNLKVGGRALFITYSPTLSAQDFNSYGQYGIVMRSEAPLQDNTLVIFVIDNAGVRFELTTWFWSQATYEAMLYQVGFKNVVWHAFQLAEAGLEALGSDYWTTLLTKPYTAILECHK